MNYQDDFEILVVEDDEIDILNVKRVFKKCGINNDVHFCQNGVEAVQFLENKIKNRSPLPKIILLDINMPKMNGLEFLKVLRNNDKLKAITVFVLTTSSVDSDISDAYNFNVAGYLVKPVHFEEFINVIKKLEAFWKINSFPKM